MDNNIKTSIQSELITIDKPCDGCLNITMCKSKGCQQKLLPCPFCGGEAEMLNGVGEYWVKCEDCNASARMSSSKGAVVKSWNERVN